MWVAPHPISDRATHKMWPAIQLGKAGSGTDEERGSWLNATHNSLFPYPALGPLGTGTHSSVYQPVL